MLWDRGLWTKNTSVSSFQKVTWFQSGYTDVAARGHSHSEAASFSHVCPKGMKPRPLVSGPNQGISWVFCAAGKPIGADSSFISCCSGEYEGSAANVLQRVW